MSNWKILNEARCKIPTRTVPPRYCSTEADGFNGMFRLTIDGKSLRIIASDGEGWQHVSVSEEYSTKPVSWSVMCQVKELFWEPEDVVIQFHPAKTQYVNYHPGVLHLWKPLNFVIPTPDPILVGPK